MKYNRFQKSIPWLLFGTGFILITASAYEILRTQATPPSDLLVVPVEVNYPAPDLTLTDIYDTSHSLEDYRGQVVLVNLWATWCEPCKREMPDLQRLYKKYLDDGFVILAVNDGDPRNEVIRFAEEYRLTFPILLDPTYIATEKAFKTMNLPSSFVLDRGGRIRLQWVGGIDYGTLERAVKPILLEAQ